ncbi:hypothetical protein BBO99_00000734 [Phytophthora kernoviae]|uniref:Uncharacterized protein n=2 Tax=Phytophthora kernoviae TaxID=325452 RepID=A0A3R7JC09_9STRA|nr:hypothetical protein G195_005190 [Phytophthora kernoviae 00238/432]KAG2527688.1 hypothetical protein JM16_001578 [Phytophthora kernoviae]KAG2528990.1 hypothetical protein JM18_001892 [Phytophthora kernoviae]RLN46807.1 hypothetical protein BBI17_000702 [Phytophthora kernoviae]RLN85148.1 hypothetical protein BBO99_00000734 [Phytophthora kernoviae]
MNDVFDAETGEKLELLVQSPIAIDETRSREAVALRPLHQHHEQLTYQPCPSRVVHPETQSERILGAHVNWEQQQVANVEKADQCFRESLAGIRHELQRSDLPDIGRLSLTIEMLEKTKRNYAQQVQTLVVEELARETDREAALRLELAPLGRERMQRRHDKERAFYRSQIARVREECEMALTAAAAKNNLLR